MSIFVHTVYSGVATDDEWFKLEKIRRMDKAFTNQIGLFHEKILSSVEGAHKPTGGFDLSNEQKKTLDLSLSESQVKMILDAYDRYYNWLLKVYNSHLKR